MGKLPPSPCKVCGSTNHWDKECPDWNTYLESSRRSANFSETVPDTESDRAYATAYSILLNQKLASVVADQPDLNDSLRQQDFEMASSSSKTTGVKESKPEGAKSSSDRRTPRVTVEEVEDEYWTTYEAKSKSVHHVLEEVVLDKEASHVAGSPSVEPNF